LLSHWSVAHDLGLTRAVPKLVHVSVPLTRRVVEPPGVVVHRTVAALACQRGLTWYEALAAELGRRARHRWREVLSEALDDIGGGSHSALEVRFVRDVVRAHGLPTPRA